MGRVDADELTSEHAPELSLLCVSLAVQVGTTDPELRTRL